MSVSFGIIRDHFGTIEVHSEPGEGATFVIRLPACQEVGTTPHPAETMQESEHELTPA